jgi:hypothetical protein
MSSPIRDDDADKESMASSPWVSDAERLDETLRLQEEVIAAAQKLERQSLREPQVLSQDSAFAERLSLQLQSARPRFELAKLRPSEDRFSLQQSSRGIWAPTLDPVSMPQPPQERTSLIGPMVVGLVGAIGVAAAVALVIVQTVQFGSVSRPTVFVRSGSERAQSFASVTDNLPRIAAAETKVKPAELAVAATASVLAAVPTNDVALAKPSVMAPQPSPVAEAARVEVAKSETAPVPPAVAPEPRPADNLSRDEIASLFQRGQDRVAAGDIASARLFLMRAAQAGNADASLALAGTFDAAVLSSLRAIGVQPDPAKARAWYMRAAEQGSEEAKRRLQQSALR